eukprot:2543171-Lingulodinium_polyedra.AAC.1
MRCGGAGKTSGPPARFSRPLPSPSWTTTSPRAGSASAEESRRGARCTESSSSPEAARLARTDSPT